MKSLILSTIFIVLLSACSNSATVTATSTATAVPTQTEIPTPTQTQSPTPTYTLTPVPTPNGIKGCVKPEQLNVRKEPGTQYAIVGILNKGTCVILIARNTDNIWFWEISDKYNGWVDGDYLSGNGGRKKLPLLSELTQTPYAVTQTLSPSKTTQP